MKEKKYKEKKILRMIKFIKKIILINNLFKTKMK